MIETTGNRMMQIRTTDKPFKITKAQVYEELCRILGDGRSGGVVCRRFDDLDAVSESDTSDDFRQLICSIQAPPSF